MRSPAEARRQRGLLSVVLPVLNNLALTRACVAALRAHTPGDLEIILVDNGSEEDFAGLARELRAGGAEVVLLANEQNEGFAFACNQGFVAARGEFVALLNNDVIVTRGWLEGMRSVLLSDARVALVGPRTNRASGPQVVKEAAYEGLTGLEKFAAGWSAAHAGERFFLPRLVGLCLLMRRELLDEVGGLDPCFWLGNFEDDDFCLRVLRAGRLLAVANGVFVHHQGSATWRSSRIDYGALLRDNWLWFCHKWEHGGELGPYPATRLAQARTFDAERDFIPLRHEEVFHPDAPPLALEGARDLRLLCIADPCGGDWKAALAAFCRAFRASDPATFVLRVEPPSGDQLAVVTRAAETLLAGLGRDAAELPDMLIDASRVHARQRGGLYTAASALLLTGSPRDPLYAREAAACGLQVLRAATPEAMRALLSPCTCGGPAR
ncbi:MAG: glycosyltransferase family 2 protein [Planctomycetes bacterium]|nr:glycosyltransferase family 2 protein [Planctomycetota bacterium]